MKETGLGNGDCLPDKPRGSDNCAEEVKSHPIPNQRVNCSERRLTPAEKKEWQDPAGTRRLDALPAGKQASAAERNGPIPKHTIMKETGLGNEECLPDKPISSDNCAEEIKSHLISN
ncbi:hypothetical protein M1I95_03775 [Rossellomorea marisflavi]|uniref:hypothetical protein n=1 Tax=Rossellomorea marisflavi TaxID=189381 RepID=UPI0027A32598|nr:hypothetical protein [Rossellomorea marisflavi]UTE73644.1 hypothetical protein M1I95_03775 [Rossellomorea marisflavi]